MARSKKNDIIRTSETSGHKYEYDGIRLPFKILRVDREWIWLTETKKIPRVVPLSILIPGSKVSRQTRADLTLLNEKTSLPKNLKGYEDDYEKYILPLMAEPFIQKVIVPALVDLYLKEKREGKPKPSDTVPPVDAVEEMARRWYGFGAWDAPFWFIGPEPGAIEDSPTYLKACAAAWMHCGGTELVDCIQYHRELGYPVWHSARAPLQPTWRALIRMLLIATGRRVGTEEIRAYQRLLWGTRDGETAVIELSSKAANSLRTRVNRGSYQAERIECLRNKIRDHKPQFVVMYGIGQKQHWEAIAGGAFTSDGLKKVGQTVIVMTAHPQARGTTNADWDRIGKVLLNAINRK